MNCRTSLPSLSRPRVLREVGLALCAMLAACQRPTQRLPPAPIFEMQTAQASTVSGDRDVSGPGLRDEGGAVSTSDAERFSGIRRIYFDRDSADLSDEARGILDRQADWLRQHPDVRASLQGHADAYGTREHQVALGEKRAAAMKFYLAARGVAVGRLSVSSFGKQRPAAVGLDEASQKLNRFGETVLIGVPGASGN